MAQFTCNLDFRRTYDPVTAKVHARKEFGFKLIGK